MIEVSFPIETALELVIRHREYAVIDKEMVARFADKETYCHIEPEKSPELFRLYRRRDWLDSVERLEAKRKASEDYRQTTYLKEEAYKKLFNGIGNAMKGMLSFEQNKLLTDNLILGARVNSAGLESYGLTKEEIARLL